MTEQEIAKLDEFVTERGPRHLLARLLEERKQLLDALRASGQVALAGRCKCQSCTMTMAVLAFAEASATLSDAALRGEDPLRGEEKR